MITAINRVSMLGVVGRMSFRRVSSDNAVLNFELIVRDRMPQGGGERVEHEERFTCCQGGKGAEHVERLIAEGDHVLVEGSYRTRPIRNQHGQERVMGAIYIREVNLLERPKAMVKR